MKVAIAFTYLLHGQIVSYTISDYDTFRAEEGIPEGTSCALLIDNEGFAQSVRTGLQANEGFEAACHRTEDLKNPGAPYAIIKISRDQ